MSPRPICVPVFFLLLCGAMPVFAEEEPLASYPIRIFRIHPHGHISVSDSHLKRMRALCVAKQDASRRR